MSEKTVAYVDKGLVFVIKNSNAVPLRLAGMVFRETRLVIGRSLLADLKRQNPKVEFVSRSR